MHFEATSKLFVWKIDKIMSCAFCRVFFSFLSPFVHFFLHYELTSKLRKKSHSKTDCKTVQGHEYFDCTQTTNKMFFCEKLKQNFEKFFVYILFFLIFIVFSAT